MENVLFPAYAEETSEIEEVLVSKIINIPAVFYVYVPPQENGKMVSWLVSDPDIEEPSLNKDFHLAFEFRDLEHARRAKDDLARELNDDTVRIFGDIE